MIKILVSALISLGMTYDLLALDVNIEYYEANDVPAEYKDGFPCSFIFFHGLPTNRDISLFKGERISGKDYKMKKMGILPVNKEGKGLIATSAMGFSPGEVVKFELKDDKSLHEEILLIPYPIYAKSWVDNARIMVILESRAPAIYTIVLEDFGENESIQFKSSNYDEYLESVLLINKNISMTLLPEVLNKKGGIAEVNIIRSTGEILKVELPWGFEWAKYFYVTNKGKAINFLDDSKLRKAIPEADEYFKSKGI